MNSVWSPRKGLGLGAGGWAAGLFHWTHSMLMSKWESLSVGQVSEIYLQVAVRIRCGSKTPSVTVHAKIDSKIWWLPFSS